MAASGFPRGVVSENSIRTLEFRVKGESGIILP